MAIGISSNLAQDAQVYMYKYNSEYYANYVCILSVLAQVSIDSAKRAFDIDLNNEIARIKEELNIKENGKADFWKKIKKKGKFKNANKKKKEDLNEKDRIQLNDEVLKSVEDDNLRESIINHAEKVNYLIDINLKESNSNMYKNTFNSSNMCPMDYICNVKMPKYRDSSPTLPMSNFFVKHELKDDRRKSKKVEELIEEHSMLIYENTQDDSDGKYELIEQELEILIEKIKGIYISGNYKGLMSHLIDRAFMITPSMQKNKSIINSSTNKNKVNLLNVLYKVNPDALLSCFSANIDKNDVHLE